MKLLLAVFVLLALTVPALAQAGPPVILPLQPLQKVISNPDAPAPPQPVNPSYPPPATGNGR